MRTLTFVIGCGRLGASIANYASQQGQSVVVIDSEKTSFTRLDDSFSGYTIVCDATDLDELRDAGINNAKEVIITTGNDNVNLFLAHVSATILGIPYVYVRFDDPEKGFLIQGLNVKPIYPFQLSWDRFNLLKSGAESK